MEDLSLAGVGALRNLGVQCGELGARGLERALEACIFLFDAGEILAYVDVGALEAKYRANRNPRRTDRAAHNRAGFESLVQRRRR